MNCQCARAVVVGVVDYDGTYWRGNVRCEVDNKFSVRGNRQFSYRGGGVGCAFALEGYELIIRVNSERAEFLSRQGGIVNNKRVACAG